MVVSAFKSSSRRSSSVVPVNPVAYGSYRPADDAGEKKVRSRRSRSVSAVSGSCLNDSSDSSVVEFVNKWDNPLFSCSSSSPSSSQEFDVVAEVSDGKRNDLDRRRGRSVSRSSGFGNRCLGYRSVSRGDTGRRMRSVSRGHCGNINKKQADVSSYDSEVLEETRNLQTWSSRHPLRDTWEISSLSGKTRNWEEERLSSSLSDVEVTMHRKCFLGDHSSECVGDGGIYDVVRSEVRRAVLEIRDDLETAIQRKNQTISTMDSTLSDLPSHDTNELVLGIGREYATKLEQSQERARKLQAELAFEEQHGHELSEILKNIVPDSKRADTHKSRPRRKASIERLKMSRRLTEEALNYFDECVSISTFDGSEFSSLEEPPPISIVSVSPVGSSGFFSNESSSSSIPSFPSDPVEQHEELVDQRRYSFSFGEPDYVASSIFSGNKVTDSILTSCNQISTPRSGISHFSFGIERFQTPRSCDIRNCINKFKKESRSEGAEGIKARSSYDADKYALNSSAENILFDKVTFKNRIDTGGLLICDIRMF